MMSSDTKIKDTELKANGLASDRCADCDAILGLVEDLECPCRGEVTPCARCKSLCWRLPGGACLRPRVDWRARAKELEEALILAISWWRLAEDKGVKEIGDFWACERVRDRRPPTVESKGEKR